MTLIGKGNVTSEQSYFKKENDLFHSSDAINSCQEAWCRTGRQAPAKPPSILCVMGEAGRHFLTLEEFSDVALIAHDVLNAFVGVHDRSHTVNAGELKQGIRNPGHPSPRQPVQGLQEEVQPTQLQELDHPSIIAVLQPLLQPGVVHH